eukprot:752060-Hanusia_phi.AAC.2
MHSNGSHISIREEDSTIFDDSDLDIPRRAQDQTSTASQHILSRPSARHLSPRSLRVKRNLLSSVHQGQDSRVPARVSHVIESVISICSREVCYMNETLDASPGDIRHRDFESISFGDVLALLGPSAFPVSLRIKSITHRSDGLCEQFCLSCQMISGSRIPVLPVPLTHSISTTVYQSICLGMDSKDEDEETLPCIHPELRTASNPRLVRNSEHFES